MKHLKMKWAAPRKVRRKRKFKRKYLQPHPKRTRKRKPRIGLEMIEEENIPEGWNDIVIW